MVKFQSAVLGSAIALMASMPAAVALPNALPNAVPDGSVPDGSVPDDSVPHVSAPETPSPDLLVAPEFSAYEFTVEVTAGPLAGQQYDGSFCYPQKAITGEGTEILSETDDFKVSINFFGNTYTESDDTSYPEFPTLTLEDGEVTQLDFWIEEGDRIVWWDLPYWEVSLSSLEDTIDCAIDADTSVGDSGDEAIDF